MASTMGKNLDELRAAFDLRQQAAVTSIGLDGFRTDSDQQQATSSDPVKMIKQRGPKENTEVCSIFSPSLNDPPLQPIGNTPREKVQHRCPRCNIPFARPLAVKDHFPQCIQINGNPEALRWFDYAIKDQKSLRALRDRENTTITPRKRKQSESEDPSQLVATNKVAKWATMAAKKQAATPIVTSIDLNNSGFLATPGSTTTTISALSLRTSDRPKDTFDKTTTLTPTPTPKQRRIFGSPLPRNVYVTQANKQQQQKQQTKSRTSRKSYGIQHNENTAHRFNNAGLLIPSIPGIDSITERLFDQGKIMSLGPARPRDGYYPGGEPRGGSFMVEFTEGNLR